MVDNDRESIAVQLIDRAREQVRIATQRTNESIQVLQQNLQNAASNKIGLEAQATMLSELANKLKSLELEVENTPLVALEETKNE